MSRLNHYAENHPVIAWAFSLFSIFTGACQWLVDHADEFAKLTGLAAALLGVAAGWYAFRINRRKWQRMEREDRRRPGRE